MATDTKAGSVLVLNKVVDLLELLAADGEQTAAELAERTGQPRTTVYRLLGSMLDLGLAETGSRSGSFRVGVRVVEIASGFLAQLDERQAAEDHLRKLHDDTGETVYLCIRRGDRAVCIDRIDGRWVRSMALQLGASLPLHIGATPRVLLAFAPSQDWNRYIADNDLVGVANRRRLSKSELVAKLQETLDQGYAVSNGETVPGLAGIAAPVFDHADTLRASIGISGLSETILAGNTDAHVMAVTETAAAVSRALGHTQR
jgi:DNA-binding IclR family transcriptional regulator